MQNMPTVVKIRDDVSYLLRCGYILFKVNECLLRRLFEVTADFSDNKFEGGEDAQIRQVADFADLSHNMNMMKSIAEAVAVIEP